MGFGGTWCGRHLIAGSGLLRTGIFATTFQASMLVIAAAIYHAKLSTTKVSPAHSPINGCHAPRRR